MIDSTRVVTKLVEVLSSLDAVNQRLFILCIVEEGSLGDAAKALGLPLGTVKSRLSRLKSLLGRVARGEIEDSLPVHVGERSVPRTLGPRQYQLTRSE